jgi:hypothetical protein
MRKKMSAVELHASWALKYVHEILQAMEREIGRMGLLSVHAATERPRPHGSMAERLLAGFE